MGGILPPAERHSSALLGVFAAISLLLLAMGDRLPTSGLRGLGAWIFTPLDRVVLFVDRMAAAWRENRVLHARLAELELENQHLRSAGVENQQLREHLDLPPWPNLNLRPVEVLALTGEPIPTAAILSAGSRQNVHVGDAAVTDAGLLGRIGEAYPNQSRVVLLTDPNSAVACEVESTGVLGVLRFAFSPRPRLLLSGVPNSDTVRVGQRVLTSGLSRRYPRGIPVGVVRSLGRDPSGLMQEVEVAPAAEISRLRHGFVIPQTEPVRGVP
jgi:rod shape-determining protein MreC